MTGVPPLSSSIGWIRGIQETRNDLLDLQRQLGTGRVSETYGGLGSGRVTSLDLRAKISSMEGYRQTIETVSLRISFMNQSLTRIDEVARDARSDIRASNFDLAGATQTPQQGIAAAQFDEVIALMNTELSGRYLFAGTETNQPATESVTNILNGEGGRDGVNQVIAERKAADAGADGRGRLTIGPAAGASLTVAEDGDHPFGFKLASVTTTVDGATATETAGPPASWQLDFTTNPTPDAIVRYDLDLPDGSRETITLSASSDGAASGSFEIGADPAATMANLEAALAVEIEALAASDLDAASAVTASRSFFSTDPSNPPQRVDGAPPETATALIDATDADTVSWYLGETGGTPRNSAIARVDDGITAGYGVRADETAFGDILAGLAAFATEIYTPGDEAERDRYTALTSRVADQLTFAPGDPSIQAIQSRLVAAESTIGKADERHVQAIGLATTSLEGVEAVDQNEVAVEVLMLQTRLQATYETTAIISQLNLVNFL